MMADVHSKETRIYNSWTPKEVTRRNNFHIRNFKEHQHSVGAFLFYLQKPNRFSKRVRFLQRLYLCT